MSQSALIYSGSSATTATASTTWYAPLNGQGALTQLETTEANAQAIFRGAATGKNFRFKAHTNGRGTDTSILIRKNGSTVVTLTITAGSTSVVSDTSTTVSFADGDTWNYAITTGTGAGNFGGAVSFELEAAGQSFTVQASFGGSGSITSARAWSFGGSMTNAATASEDTVSTKALEARTLSNLQVLVRTNGSSGFTCKTRVNNADGTLTLSVGSTATGWFEDTTHSDSVAANGLYCMQNTLPSVAMTLGYNAVKVLGSAPGASVLNGYISATVLAAGSTRFSAFNSTFGTTEGQCQVIAPFAGTILQLGCYVAANGSSTTVTVDDRVNGSSGTLTMSVGAGATGFFQDTTNSDAFTATQTLGLRATGATTSSVTFGWIGAKITGPYSLGGGLTLLGAG